MKEQPNVEEAGVKTASFEGRLQLQDFMHCPAVASPSPSPGPSTSLSPIHRSPRLIRASSSQAYQSYPIPSSSSGPSPLQRKPSSSSTSTPLAASASPSTSSKKRKRNTSGYAPPSTYAHLPGLTDSLGPNLLILFVGLNPGIRTAQTGHAYAHPSNLFWKLLHSSRITDRLVPASLDSTLPVRYSLGLTNIVARPTRNGGELRPAELDAGFAALEDKVRRCRPEVVCLVGKSIWESVVRVRRGRALGKGAFSYGWQDEAENIGAPIPDEGAGGDGGGGWSGARVFVSSSTSGLAATLSPAEKEKIWRELGDWCVKRRAERAERAAEAGPESSLGIERVEPE
ncbi:DNA glycosylase [Sodiomyces alkalinus F11]|uniref:DNA glycosylase n=1 Tax=Sodiomyces alkalinus (strain CBS 110278 / VKM F-3762 / F11) TaxID=1314773 RepID=A0A3N2PZW7_SODAK|nr:DNA glycosylase [Sodiomyces alkalinus F11]ROT39976.1 DNA glycosylase [Sodiomyces alkalinus F11]